MSIKEGFESVHRAMFGFGPDESLLKGRCDRCKAPLSFSPVNGNCQPDCQFAFGFKHKAKNPQCRSIFNGVPGEVFGWEARLCNQCLISLSKWLEMR